MFCKNCGAQLNEGVKFCSKCGAPAAGGDNSGQQDDSNTRAQAAKKPPYLAIGAIVLGVIVLLLAGKFLFGRGYVKPLKAFVKGIEQEDGEKILSVYSKKTVKKMEDNFGLEGRKLEKYWEKNAIYALTSEELEGKDIKIKYKIEDNEKLDKDDIKDIEKELKEYMDIREDVSAARELEVAFTIYEDGDKEDEVDVTMEVIKVDGKWYLNWGSFEY
ncbi:zinc-ribbon domain-containing protein [Mediterraneibacter massiliensis]|uniref:zinc-ribbon domain-containing protein n=1 Tax=Mediterraneibacter massiliensis TaxID=1720300 RepID=UPI0024ADDEC0|nr:zinc-ribbon domain-containing protein [Mediterraneibacter massiliensis]